MITTQSTSLKKVASVFNGKTPSKAEQRNTGHPVLKIKDVDAYGRFIGQYDSFVEDDVIKKNSGKLLLGNETLILNAAHNADYVGTKVFFSEPDVKGALPTGEWLIVRANEAVLDAKFAHYWIQSDRVRKKIRGLVKGIHLYPKDVAELEINLPPLDEQKRIAGILDKADAIRRKRAESLKLLDELLRATFLDMFGDPITNPKGWEYKTAIDFCDCIVPGRDKPKSFTGDTPWVTTSDLNHLGLTAKSINNLGLSRDEIQQVRARVIPAGSVILTCVGDLGVISIAANEMVINQQLHAFICEDINKWFLMYALSFQKSFMYQRSTQTTLPYMNKTACNSIPVFNPPKSLQDRFGEICAKAQSNYAQIANAATESDTLFHSLVARAFKGELTRGVKGAA